MSVYTAKCISSLQLYWNLYFLGWCMGRNHSIWVFMALLRMYGRKDIRYYRVGLMQSKWFGKSIIESLIYNTHFLKPKLDKKWGLRAIHRNKILPHLFRQWFWIPRVHDCRYSQGVLNAGRLAIIMIWLNLLFVSSYEVKHNCFT